MQATHIIMNWDVLELKHTVVDGDAVSLAFTCSNQVLTCSCQGPGAQVLAPVPTFMSD